MSGVHSNDVLSGMLAISMYLKRSETTVLKMYREQNLPMRKNCGAGIWFSSKQLIDEWNRKLISETESVFDGPAAGSEVELDKGPAAGNENAIGNGPAAGNENAIGNGPAAGNENAIGNGPAAGSEVELDKGPAAGNENAIEVLPKSVTLKKKNNKKRIADLIEKGYIKKRGFKQKGEQMIEFVLSTSKA